MDEDFLHTDGPFAIPSFSVKPNSSAEDVTVKLEPLPLLEDHQADWLQTPDDLNDDIPDIDSPSEVWTDEVSIPPLESVPDQPETINEDDVWKLSAEDVVVPSPKPSKSWEQLGDPAFKVSCRYLRQAEPGAFDIILRLCDPDEEHTRPVKPDVFLSSLFQLGLGRDSILFVFDRNGSILWRDEEARLSGLSSPATRSVADAFTQSGQLFRAIRHLGSYIYRKGRFPTATVAFAQVSGTILLELERYVNARRPAESLIRLQEDFKLPFKVLTLLYDIFKGLRSFETDQQALSFLYEIGQEVEMSELCLTELMHEIVSHASKPWLDSVAACVGIMENDAASNRMRRELESSIDWGGTLENDNLFDEAFPTFFSIDDRRLVMQVFQGMKVLEDRHSSFTAYKSLERAQQLRWLFTWDEIIDAEYRARMLDEAIDRLVDPPLARQKNDDEQEGVDSDQDALAMLRESYSRIENTVVSTQSGDSLVRAIHCALDTSRAHSILSTQPALDISAAQSFNALLRHRARAVNRACLAELFQPSSPVQPHLSLNLSDHMNLLHNFFLMNHGMFVTRLSHALFDPSLSSSERSKGQVRTGGHVGLRLGSRATWPPASSELQLALAGVLATSFAEDHANTRKSTAINRSPSSASELPGRLSFALRNLSDEEIDRCLDPDGLEALDFLRISYTPPRPLDVVILPEVLEKYDRVFMLLLRLQRLVFVVNHVFQSYRMTLLRNGGQSRSAGALKDEDTPPAALRLAHAAHHLVTAFMEYVLTSAIAEPWKRISAAISTLQDAVDTDARDKRSSHGERQDAVETDPASSTSNSSSNHKNSKSTSTSKSDSTAPPTPKNQTRQPPPSHSSSQSQRITERHGISHLRRLHDRTLDQILDGCLLRRRHERVRNLLDDIFRIILEFAAVKREQELDDSANANDSGGEGNSDDGEQYERMATRRKNRHNHLLNDDDDSDNDDAENPAPSPTSSSSSSEISQTSHTTQTHQGATGRDSPLSPSPLRSSSGAGAAATRRRGQQRGQTRHRATETQDQELAREERRHERELVIGQLYARFRRQVALFVTVCRGLVVRKGEEGSGGGGGGGGGFEGEIGEGQRYRDERDDDDGIGWEDGGPVGLPAGISEAGEGGGLEALVTRLSVNDFYGEKLVR